MKLDELLSVLDNWQPIRVTDGRHDEHVFYEGDAENCHPWGLNYKDYDVVEVCANGGVIEIEVGE